MGSALVPQLVSDGYKVRVLDLYLYGDVLPKASRNLEHVRGDLRDPKVVEWALSGVDTVIHLACISNDPSFELDPKLGRSINYDATIQLVDLAKKNGVSRFIFASSSSVYGVKKEKEVTEDLPLEPLTDYSRYKALCEEYILRSQEGFPCVIVRPATVCGWAPRMRLDLTVNILTIQALASGKMTIFGGRQERPNIHVKDMVDAYRLLLKEPDKRISGKIYNVGYQNLSLLAIGEMIKKILRDESIEVVIKPTKDTRSYRISSEKIRKELGFVPKHTVEDAIGDIAHAYKSGRLNDPLENMRYYNIRIMKLVKLA